MNVSRLTFTKETKEKMSKPLNHFQVGELRWKKIKELSANGKLAFAKSRLDIVEMLGAVRGYNNVYNWVTNMIRRGYIKETLTGIGKDGKVENEYSVVKSPNFDTHSLGRKAFKAREDKRKDADVSMATMVTPVVLDKDDTKPVVLNSNTGIVIRYKDLSIEINNISQSIIEGIIEKLATIAGQ